MEQEYLSIRGGVRMGSFNASWPLAQILVRSDSIDVKVALWGRYSFARDEVIAIQKYCIIPRLGWGVQIVHNVPGYPQKIIFWTFRDPQEVIAQIQAGGFLPSADSVEMPPEQEMPVKILSIAVIIVVWNFLLIIAYQGGVPQLGLPPRALLFVVLCLLFLGTAFFDKLIWLQHVILKPGREASEIKGWVKLLALISGALLIGFLIEALFPLIAG